MESPKPLFNDSTHNFGIAWTSWSDRHFYLIVKLYSYFIVFYDLYFPFMSTKPLKLITWFEKIEKHALLFPILILY